MILNILIYIYLLFFLICFFKKKITNPKLVCWGVFFLIIIIELDFFSSICFSYSKKKQFHRKGLMSLTFFFFHYCFQHLSIWLKFDFAIVSFCYHVVK
jgi:hypothetical protein